MTDRLSLKMGRFSHEGKRLREVRSFEFIKKDGDTGLDHIVRLASRIFGASTSLISLVDKDVQWFAARKGFDRVGTPRAQSFCAFALAGAEPLVVLDARQDERFSDNPLVVADPFIRFYAGAPLISRKGNVLGTLCVIDTKPRSAFSDEDLRMLGLLAELAMESLDFRRLSETRRAALCLNRTSPDAIFHVDNMGIITYANRAARKIFGYEKEALVSHPIAMLLPDPLQKRMAAAIRLFRRAGTEFLSFEPIEATAIQSTGREIPIEFSAGIWSSDGSFRLGIIVRDIADRKRRDASFELLFERNPVPMWIFDAASLDFIAVNDAACALYRFTREDALTKNALDMRLESERAGVRDTISNFGEYYASEKPGIHIASDGTKLRILSFARRLRHQNQDCVVVANIDVTEREHAAQELASTRIFLDAIVESIPSMVFVKDATDGKFVLLNKAGEELLGILRGDLIGKTDFDLFPPREAERFRDADRDVVASGQLVTIENEPLSTKEGVRSLRTQKVGVPDADGNPRYLLGISEDVTERLRVEERNLHLSLHDILTDLPNRLAFQTALEEEIVSGGGFALILIDLDRFKAVNDSFGHQAGDELLRQLASRLSSTVGPNDVVARLGGDEFGVLLRGGAVTESTASGLAADIIAAVEQPFSIGDELACIGCSAGIVLSPRHGSTSRALIRRGDLALYAAKTNPRSGYVFFEHHMEEKVAREKLLRDELASALSKDQFDIEYQPIVDARSGKLVCCEALLRWRHPERGVVSPAEFIPIAEASGLIEQVGQWVVEQACIEAAKWPSDVKIAVNLSPRQFTGLKLVAAIAKALAVSGLSPTRLELEITESVLLSDSDENLRLLNDLKSLGVHVALDDFGTGYSSLAYLRQFSFDKLKIDRSFVADLTRSAPNLAIVRAVIGLGKSFSALITAEGVETEEQLECLRREGCDQCQGYLFSRPVSATILRRTFLQNFDESALVPAHS